MPPIKATWREPKKKKKKADLVRHVMFRYLEIVRKDDDFKGDRGREGAHVGRQRHVVSCVGREREGRDGKDVL